MSSRVTGTTSPSSNTGNRAGRTPPGSSTQRRRREPDGHPCRGRSRPVASTYSWSIRSRCRSTCLRAALSVDPSPVAAQSTTIAPPAASAVTANRCASTIVPTSSRLTSHRPGDVVDRELAHVNTVGVARTPRRHRLRASALSTAALLRTAASKHTRCGSRADPRPTWLACLCSCALGTPAWAPTVSAMDRTDHTSHLHQFRVRIAELAQCSDDELVKLAGAQHTLWMPVRVRTRQGEAG